MMKRGHTDGFILYATLSLLILIAVMVGTALVISNINVRSANDNVRVSQVQALAEGGLDEAVSKVWYDIWPASTPTSYYRVSDYKKNLVTQGWGVNTSASYGPFNLSGVGNYQYKITRLADTTDQATHFLVESTGVQTGGTSRKITQDIYVGGGLFNGISYAVLTNNANCVMCHASVQSTQALATGNPVSSQTPFRRAKFATLESLQTRPSEEDSVLAGTFYTRGGWVDGNGNNVASSSGFKTTQATGDGNITTPMTTAGSAKNFSVFDCSNATQCAQTSNQNFYTNYPTQDKIGQQPFNGKWPDGELPDSFPLPVADTDGNRNIDDTEWNNAVSTSTSQEDPDNPPGAITATMKQISPTGTLGTNNFGAVQAGQTAGTGYTGNLVLDGTQTPINVNGTVYVNGDVIIRGKIKGNGKIIARGNVYVVGDVKYACGNDNHECNGTDWATVSDPDSDVPKFALSAVGNISLGDFETPRYGDWSDPNFLETENSQSATIKTGSNVGQSVTKGGQTSTVPGMAWREATLFNRLEMKKFMLARKNGQSYVPRLYKFANNSPDLVFWNDPTDEGTDNYASSSYRRIDADCATDVNQCPKGTFTENITGQKITSTAAQLQQFLAAAAVYTVAPKTNWVGRSQLKKMYLDSTETTSRSKGAFRFDGLLYSSNATFALAKPGVSNACLRNVSDNGGCSKTNGSLEIRGSLMSADTGILSSGPWGNGNKNVTPSFSVYHDDRLSSFVKLRNTQRAGLYRADWSLER